MRRESRPKAKLEIYHQTCDSIISLPLTFPLFFLDSITSKELVHERMGSLTENFESPVLHGVGRVFPMVPSAYSFYSITSVLAPIFKHVLGQWADQTTRGRNSLIFTSLV